MASEDEIREELHRERQEIESIEENLFLIKEKLLEKTPSHFSKRDVVNAFFASLIFGMTFVLKGATVSTALNLTDVHVTLIIVFTILALVAEIYFIGYSRVKDKSTRRFGQFMAKRLCTLYFITIVVSFFLVYIFNLNNAPNVHTFYDQFKIVVVVAMPCAIGAAIPSLLKQY
ncbi:MAG: DUF2391 family protein [Candidatus Woesearchaeota archaeon]